jgi:hypothetical protein
MNNRTYIIYDQRAMTMSTDDATVLDTADTLREAKESAVDFGGCVYSYRDEDGTLVDERFEWFPEVAA